MKVKLTIEYNGSAFVGWQEQSNGVGVQNSLGSALHVYLNSLLKRSGLDLLESAPTISGSGRTDSGVHALGQVASFEWPEALPFDADAMTTALNGILPREIALQHASAVEDNFDARITKHRKQYSYYFVLRKASEGYFLGRAWRVPATIDIPAMCKAARLLVGNKDFASFRAADCVAKSSVRTLHVCELTRESEHLLRLVVQGNGFLKQMIRIIAGTLLEVGKGQIAPEEIERILDSRSRQNAGKTAPACGLVLDWVSYDQQFRDRNKPEEMRLS